MTDFTIHIDVDAQPEQVFGYIADGTRTPEWYEAVEAATKLTDGPVGEGTRFQFTRRLPQGHVINEVEVSEFDEPSVVAFHSLQGPTPFTYRYAIEPAGEGSRVSLEGSITGKGLTGPARLLAPMADKFFAHGMNRNLRLMKQRVEHA